MFGSLITFAPGVLTISPSSPSVSRTRCAGVRRSENCARMRAATEMSIFSTATPAGSVKRRMMGSSAYVASIGASSQCV
jgi:replicative DNA helicase